MDIFSIVEENACTPFLKARSKSECLKELAELISPYIPDHNTESISNILFERESKGSTAFGEGIAIPHARLKDIDNFVISVAVSRKGIDFESLDKKKTRIFFTIIGPGTKQEQYLKILAQISRVAKNRYARKELLNARSSISLKESLLRYISPEEEGKPKKDLEDKKVLLITLYEKKYLDDLIEVLISNGIGGISILESRGTRNILSNVPLFSEFINFTGERSEISRTILSIVDSKVIPQVVEGIETIMGDLNKHSGAMVLALDISFMKGTLEVL